jgi:hypothetical protein
MQMQMQQQQQMPAGVTPMPQQQTQQPQPQQETMSPRAGPSSAAPAAGSAAAAPNVSQGQVCAARFRQVPDVPLGDLDDAMLISTDINLLNTSDMNLVTSGLNAFLPSEEILRFVPTPEEATASRSTAWL